jgi:hypothetical protein
LRGLARQGSLQVWKWVSTNVVYIALSLSAVWPKLGR